MRSEWESKIFSYTWLKEKANDSPGMMMDWLVRIGVVPRGTKWKRTNRIVNTSLKPSGIPAGYLAEVAYEWDSWGGGSTSRQFIQALSFEMAGSEKKAIATEMVGVV
jgi:hypothetical protein